MRNNYKDNILIKIIHRIMRIVLGQKGIYCAKGRSNTICAGAYLHEYSSIGSYNYIGPGTRMINGCIGNYCSIAQDVKIGLFEHDLECVSTSTKIFGPEHGITEFDGFLTPATIENDVWIGANAIIKQGVTIHTGAVVGAGAIVLDDVPEYAIVVGVPAKLLRYRFTKSQKDCILSSKWWELKPEEARIVCKDLQKKICNLK